MSLTARNLDMIVKLVIPYIVVLFIPLILGLMIYKSVLNIMENEIMTSNLQALAQSQKTFDSQLDVVRKGVEEILTNPKVVRFQTISSPYDAEHISDILDVKNSLYRYSIFNPLISNYFILFKKKRVHN